MTDNEIIKGLECCSRDEKSNKYTCKKCPYVVIEGFCYDKVIRDAIDLINRQQAEIERLQKQNEYLKSIETDKINEFADRLIYKAGGIMGDNHEIESYVVPVTTYNDLLKEMVGEE